MLFLIGVIIFILFIIIVYFFIKSKIKKSLEQFGFNNINEIISYAKLEDQEVPKSLASMDRLYLEQIKKDFPQININLLKRQSEKVICDCFKAIEEKDSNSFFGKIKLFIDNNINDYQDSVLFKNFKIHNTVVSKYENSNGIATIYFSSSFEYILLKNGESKKIQDRVKTEFIYVIDISKVDLEKKVLGINCPNCGSPITSLGLKKCSYCGSIIKELFSKIFTCNDVVRY